MRITPTTIRQKEFKRGRKGYDDAEVDGFLDQIADELENLGRENVALAQNVRALNEKVASYTQIEDALRMALVSAQTSAEGVKREASEAAEAARADAELKAQQMLNTAHSEKRAVEQDTAKARKLEEDFRQAFRRMLQGYLAQIESPSGAGPGPVEDGAVPETNPDFDRHADAIREAISREESALLAPKSVPAPPPVPAGGAPAHVPAAAPPPPVAQAPQAAGDAAPQVPAPGERPGDGVRILFGERDDLLNDVAGQVDENGFKW